VVPVRRPSFWSRLAVRPAIAIALVLALLVAGTGAAAASSLPGDPAFGLKRVVEDAQVALSTDDLARLNLLVAISDRRLADLETAVATRPDLTRAASDEYILAVARVDAVLGAALGKPATPARDAAIASASAASADHLAQLQALLGRLPAPAQPGIQRAIDAQQTVHGKAGDAPGRPTSPSGPPASAPGRPSDRGGQPSKTPGRP
jgi:hypothetical protein